MVNEKYLSTGFGLLEKKTISYTAAIKSVINAGSPFSPVNSSFPSLTFHDVEIPGI